MDVPNKQLEAMLLAFDKRADMPADATKNLRDVITGNPVLLAQLNAAAKAGDLKHFAVLGATANAGGTFDPSTKTLNLPLASLRRAPDGSFDPANMAFVLAHEVQHASNAEDVDTATKAFEASLTTTAKSKAAAHDYTPAIAARIEASRKDEAKAEISGWNAVRGALLGVGKTPTLELMYEAQTHRIGDFIIKDSSTRPPSYALRDGLAVEADLSMPMSAANVNAMGIHYFNQKPEDTGIGAKGNSDYPNYYGASAVGRAIYLDRFYADQAGAKQSRVEIKLDALGLAEALLETNGIDLGMKTSTPQKVYDTSTKPLTAHIFQHTSKTHTHVPVEAQRLTPPFEAPEILRTSTRDAVLRLDAALGRAPDSASAAMTESLTLLAVRHGLRRVDEVVLSTVTASHPAGHTVFAIENAPYSEQRRWIGISTDRAVNPNTAQALRAGADLNAISIAGGARVQATSEQARAAALELELRPVALGR